MDVPSSTNLLRSIDRHLVVEGNVGPGQSLAWVLSSY